MGHLWFYNSKIFLTNFMSRGILLIIPCLRLVFVLLKQLKWFKCGLGVYRVKIGFYNCKKVKCKKMPAFQKLRCFFFYRLRRVKVFP